MHRVAFEHLLATFHQRIRKRAAHIAERLEERKNIREAEKVWELVPEQEEDGTPRTDDADDE